MNPHTKTPNALSTVRVLVLLLALVVVAAACSGEEEEGSESAQVESASICSADGLVSAVENGAEEGTLSGMADDPVATAASNNPVLTTLVDAVQTAELGDTLNNAEALTVFAPTDCAFAGLDEATLQAALDDPSGLLTDVLGFHVVPGQRLGAEDLTGGSLETFSGQTLNYTNSGGEVVLDGQASVVVPDIQTANATVHLIDSVMIPGQGGGGQASTPDQAEGTPADVAAADSSTLCSTEELVAAVEGGAAEGTLSGMADDPVATAASNNPVLTSLVEAVVAADLVDTLNSAEALTVFAPTDCAFAGLDQATLDAAMADPQGLLTTVLGFHVVVGERLQFEQLDGGELDTFAGAALPYTFQDNVVTLNGQAQIVVPNIQTANATVHLIDTVMLPPSG